MGEDHNSQTLSYGKLKRSSPIKLTTIKFLVNGNGQIR